MTIPAPKTKRRAADRWRFDIGLALLCLRTPPHVTRTQREIAIWCDCSQQLIAEYERLAIRKLRHALRHL